MIEEITNYSEFLFIQPQFTIELKNHIESLISSNKISILNNNTTILIQKFMSSIGTLEHNHGVSKKILFALLNSIQQINKNSKIDNSKLNIIKDYFILENDNYHLAKYLLKIENEEEIANEIFLNFLDIYFNHKNLFKKDIVEKIKKISQILDKYYDENNDFITSLYVFLLRTIMNRNAILEDETLTQNLIQKVNTSGVRRNFLHYIDEIGSE